MTRAKRRKTQMNLIEGNGTGLGDVGSTMKNVMLKKVCSSERDLDGEVDVDGDLPTQQ